MYPRFSESAFSLKVFKMQLPSHLSTNITNQKVVSGCLDAIGIDDINHQ